MELSIAVDSCGTGAVLLGEPLLEAAAAACFCALAQRRPHALHSVLLPFGPERHLRKNHVSESAPESERDKDNTHSGESVRPQFWQNRPVLLDDALEPASDEPLRMRSEYELPRLRRKART